MKKIWLVAVGVMLLGLVFAVGCTTASGQTITPTPVSTQQQGIWVSGTGKVTVTPDIANISLGIQAQDTSVAAAQAAATQAMDQVLASLKANGIADKDIQTQYYSINQVTHWDQNTGKQIVDGYSVSNTVTVKVRVVSAAGKVIDDVAKAGGDLARVNSVYFSVDNPEQYYPEARQNAMDDAKTKAQQLASAGGVTLGNLTYISEGSVYVPQPPVVYYKESYAADGAVPAPATSINPGETEISLTVQLVYDIQ